MYRVLIVDDETIERKGLHKIISDQYPSVVIEEAENGRMALLKAEQFRPDVVFMDIKMPGIDGVEAAREIKKMNESVQIIMVTAFDTFEYARQVMKIGVKDYILKPSSREEIIDPLAKIFNQIEEERVKRTEEIILKDNYRRALSIVQSRVITSMLMDGSSRESVFELEWEENFQKESFIMVFEFQTAKNEKIISIHDIMNFLQAELNHFFPNHFIGEDKMNRLPVLIQVGKRESNQKIGVRDLAVTCGKEIIKKVQSFYPNYNLSIGIGRVYNEIEKFVQSYHEALFALSSLKQPNTCEYYNQHLKSKPTEGTIAYPYQSEKLLLETITSGDKEKVATRYRKYMEELTYYCEQRNETVEEKLSEFIVLLDRQIIDSGISLQTSLDCQSISQFQDKLVQIANHIYMMYYSKNQDVMLVAKDYIIEHYEKALTLEEVAEVVQLSPQYFSKIFKERVGSSFIDYLTELRVEKAKDLMRSKGISVKEVCYEVGYKDPNYFSRVFKKHTGISPSDYRSNIK
ncbi:response regulator [Halalkalibacter akibai]|uniref:DNA-binding response regulator n=1 Tax=Halalkalibacter akibai (strain ATCC 43226 / DSM 21942 / CIP 109018 / JCM 9157 / 1139) TaxID=1236973 RepID=W4QYM8_HALA3|nr:response regulator [Halalkalibacter akibai]GAE36773.1 DNA-binding response regulator [Halalkalibacter akibai JCM 9157]